MNDDVFTIDPRQVDHLGPANAEQRAERKERRRSWWRTALRDTAVVFVSVAVGIVLMAVGFVLGVSLGPDVLP